MLDTHHSSRFCTTTVRRTSDAHVAITMPYAAGTRLFISTLMTQGCSNVVLLYKKYNTSTAAQWKHLWQPFWCTCTKFVF